MSENSRKVLLGLTTTPGSDWREKFREIDGLGLDEIALFLTFLNLAERKELYTLLEKTSLKSIPHVHLRNDDMEEWEMDFLMKKYKTQVFNIHPEENPFRLLAGKYGKRIYVENLYGVYRSSTLFNRKAFEKYKVTGICLDFSHIEAERRTDPKGFEQTISLMERFRVECNHVSAIKDEMYIDPIDGIEKYDLHKLEKIEQLDYLKKFPLKYFSNYISIELENSFKEQQEAKKYIDEIIRQKEKYE